MITSKNKRTLSKQKNSFLRFCSAISFQQLYARLNRTPCCKSRQNFGILCLFFGRVFSISVKSQKLRAIRSKKIVKKIKTPPPQKVTAADLYQNYTALGAYTRSVSNPMWTGSSRPSESCTESLANAQSDTDQILTSSLSDCKTRSDSFSSAKITICLRSAGSHTYPELTHF